VHPPGRLDGAEAHLEPVQQEFDMRRDALSGSAEGLSKAEKIAVEVQSRFNIPGVEIHQACGKHAQKI
jgi:hypothetical protein